MDQSEIIKMNSSVIKLWNTMINVCIFCHLQNVLETYFAHRMKYVYINLRINPYYFGTSVFLFLTRNIECKLQAKFLDFVCSI
jgi:hypothetical protein